ncbi:hypothetical protein OGZ02_07045 [Brachyspira hyodysenteriae]|nr:hypothetical protein [Brachyspira hyodysenteriae]
MDRRKKENNKIIINFTKKEISNNIIKKGSNKKSGDKILYKKSCFQKILLYLQDLDIVI